MGYIRHDAIIATSGNPEHLKAAHEKALEIGLPCSEIIMSPTNGYETFLIAPDGSKEGWGASDEGDKMRDEWKAWIRGHDVMKGQFMWVDWAHISYGGDEPQYTAMKDHSGDDTEHSSANAESSHGGENTD